MTSATSNRGFNRFRSFSLRTGLVMFLIIGISLGLIGRWYHDVRERGANQRWLVDKDLTTRRSNNYPRAVICEYATETSVGSLTGWIRRNIDADYGRELTHVNVTRELIDENPKLDLAKINGANSVYLYEPNRMSSVAQAFGVPGVKSITIVKSGRVLLESTDWISVRNASELNSISIEEGRVGADFAEQLAKLPKLSKVSISSCTPDAFVRICGIKNLEQLSLGGYTRFWMQGVFFDNLAPAESSQSIDLQIREALNELANRNNLKGLDIRGQFPHTPEPLAEFCKKSGIRRLRFHCTNLSPECYSKWIQLRDLTELDLDEPQIKDEHLTQLVYSASLRSIQIRAGINNSAEAILALRTKMPICEIWRF